MKMSRLISRRMELAVVVATFATAALAGCATSPGTRAQTAPVVSSDSVKAAPATPADAQFAGVAKRWLDGWLQLGPVNATQVGDHRFDGEIDDLSPNGRAVALAFNRKLLAELDAVDFVHLSRENQVDALIMRNQITGDIWNLDVLQSWAWDPQVYNGLAGGAIYNLMARDFAPLPVRLKAATLRIQKIPALFAQMRANLDPARVPMVHAETVAKQINGVLQLVDQFITPNEGQLDAADRATLDAAIATLRTSVAEQQAWLTNTLVPGARGNFRLGAKLYDEKLVFSLNSMLTRAQIRTRAAAEITRVRAEMYAIAQSVLKDKSNAPPLPAAPSPDQQQKAIEAALELAYAERPARDQVVPFAKAALANATTFVRAHDLVTVPNDPVKVILMPEFQRGVAVAYCDSPGPLDKGLDTYFAISPIPDDWTAAQADSFLREYNDRMINLLAIHEAMPGHYLEGAHSAQFPSTVRAVLRSGTFAEGWAVYTERMMTEQGYLDHDPLFHLVQLKFYLRSVANAILDQAVHVDGMTREQAMDLMTRLTFQQEREAAGKWVRVQLTSAQLPMYFVGVQEQLDLRSAMQARLGAKFNLKAYHDRVLSYGAPPVRFVRELMLDEPIH